MELIQFEYFFIFSNKSKSTSIISDGVVLVDSMIAYLYKIIYDFRANTVLKQGLIRLCIPHTSKEIGILPILKTSDYYFFCISLIRKTPLTLELTDKNAGSNNSWPWELGNKALLHPKNLYKLAVKNKKQC